MARRIVTAREQVEMLSPWKTASEGIPTLNPEWTGGNFHFQHQGFTPGTRTFEGSGTHAWDIIPPSSPAQTTLDDDFGRSHTVHYDPAVTQVVQGQFGPQTTTKPNHISDFSHPPGMLWRGMSNREYQRAKQQGYFQSSGNYNIGDAQKGLTYFSTNPSQAESYSSGFAPWQFQPTFTEPAHVVGILNRPHYPQKEGSGEGNTERGIPGSVPFSEMTHHYVGNPYAIYPGKVEISNDNFRGRWEENGRSNPKVNVQWSEAHPQHREASRHTAMPSEHDVYDGFYDEEEYDPNERPEPHEGPWYHYSPTKMPVGTHLTGGHDSPWGDNLYEKDGTEHRRDYVWLSPTVTEAVGWAGTTPNKGDNGRGYVYRVEPSSNVLPWNGTGSDGWVADGAHIAEELPHPWKEPHTASRTAMPRQDAYGNNWGTHGRQTEEPTHPQGQVWYHRSDHDLPDGTMLTPSGGKSRWNHVYREDDNRKKWVWLSTPDMEHFYGPEQGRHLYQVQPEGEGPYPWNDDDSQYVAPRARIIRKIKPKEAHLTRLAAHTSSSTPFIARGFKIDHPEDDHDLFDAIHERRATPEQLHKLVTRGGSGGVGKWWGTYGGEHGEFDPENKAYGRLEDFQGHSENELNND